MIKLGVENLKASQRIDSFIAAKLPIISRSSIRKLFNEAKISCNKVVAKQNKLLKNGDKIEINFDLDSLSKLPNINMPIIYEDDDCLVIDKSIGILTHSKGVFNPEATVASFISSKISPELTGDRAGIVHRLDRATSGVIICAKTAQAQKWLQKQFSQRKVKKTYLAVVSGKVDLRQAIIDVPIGRDRKNPKIFKADEHGKTAQTAYRVINSNSEYSWLELQPKTGRTHQIRVHLAHLKHPIIGDEQYGGPKSDRLYLHAYSLEITLPNKRRKVFVSKQPFKFKNHG